MSDAIMKKKLKPCCQLCLFLKRLFCWHYWGDGVPITGRATGLCRFTCVKCGKERLRLWAWGPHENIRKHGG